MKKLVPDPPFPIPYLTIIQDLTPEAAMAHAANLMETLVDTVHAYVECPQQHRPGIMLENSAILSHLVVLLINHAIARREEP
ncbi:hypothetical protein [Pseudomonas xanthosomatis]|uniref:hypothetical protein n=1 Tax=Pseudomonas xanthosomatis TaxID=2842356 RepID=UPI003517084B